jgi:hypothetical protein
MEFFIIHSSLIPGAIVMKARKNQQGLFLLPEFSLHTPPVQGNPGSSTAGPPNPHNEPASRDSLLFRARIEYTFRPY